MRIIESPLPGVLVVEPRVFDDDRGCFYESYNEARFQEAGIRVNFVQTNVSRSSRGVLRGLHYQHPAPQGKLISVLAGEVYDVAVDIRHGSPTFGQWTAVMLTESNYRHLWVPEGFAHGFCVVSDTATLMYQCTTHYDASADASLRWDDPALAIDWPVRDPLLSPKDQRAPLLAEVPPGRLPGYVS
ncbi:dTDP-4-dehydrorhamnose 3,5-epimerase [Dyella sp. ASV21]|jgi:dTDP-4-dehydrorhamnose 3,5-epimerase|uniref:dTDP-4-dehydrorhamnose 3,5-epimerase n=1 Tax=Dyella sp. ASV21 TaxID=2795114 RepID=UPI0018ECE8C6|nr:dTDP-4-dehydrorhamnose 3,5-epimerase [Dyella sp. ASV21]